VERTTLHHVVLTVGDPTRSRAFYGDVLGLPVVPMDHVPGGGYSFEVGETLIFVFGSRQPIPGDRFGEFRIGLDHLSFGVSAEADLQRLVERLRKAGVETNGIEVFPPTGNRYVAFRGPTNLQLEFWLG
jgi:catechol 2,3-dioxygenase-like lactoylglutathione lyase family enzyme